MPITTWGIFPKSYQLVPDFEAPFLDTVLKKILQGFGRYDYFGEDFRNPVVAPSIHLLNAKPCNKNWYSSGFNWKAGFLKHQQYHFN